MPDRISIIVLDDEPDFRRTVTKILTREGYSVREAANGAELRRLMDEQTPDLILLDLVLKQEDGLDIARRLRAESMIPIIILTGKNDVVDRIIGLELGADDYIVKPFHKRELLARIKTVLRRAVLRTIDADRPSRTKITFSGWTLDLQKQQLITPDGAPCPLTAYEYRVLAALAERPQRVLSRAQLLDIVANRDWTPYDRSIDVVISKLRRKLGDDPKSPKIIRTVRNMGYIFLGTEESPSA